jgi:hypothetical protein
LAGSFDVSFVCDTIAVELRRRTGQDGVVAVGIADVPAWLGALNAAEGALWTAFPLGGSVDLRVGDPAVDDVGNADHWSASRQIRAVVVVALLLGARPATAGRLAAVRLRGVRITGDIDLRDCEVRHPLSITDSCLETVRADNAFCRSISLRGCRLGALKMTDGRLDGVLDLRECRFVDPVAREQRVHLGGTEVSGSVMLSRALVHGQVRCTTAHIGGTLRLQDAVLLNSGGTTLDARLLTTGNQVHAEQLHSQGRIDLTDARLGGRLLLDGALLENPDGDTLTARQLAISGELSMRRTSRPFVSRGRINMPGARIEGTVGMQEASLSGRLGAFHAGGISVGRSLRLAGADIDGTVMIPGAVIRDQLDFGGTQITSPERFAFSGQGLTVAREARFERYTLASGATRPFRADAAVHLDGASIGGNLRMHGAHLAERDGEPALNLVGAQITHGLLLKDGLTAIGELRLMAIRIGGHLNLNGMTSPDALLMLYSAAITEVVDDGDQAWPNRLDLDGFTYDHLAPYRPAAERVRLLERQVGGYRPRPYEQLAAYYRRLGHEDEARAVLLARQRARRASLPAWRRVPGYLSDALAGYGYRPGRALGWAIGLLLLGSEYFSHSHPRPLHPADHPVFNPVLYTADQLIPLIHFGTGETWQPQGAALAVATALTVCGWVLSIAIAAGATRALSRS